MTAATLELPGSVVFEGKRSIQIGSRAYLLEEDRELAWAENHIVRNPAYKWVLGKFVQADQANSNGHIFGLDELRDAKSSVLYAPMNMLHRGHYIVGTYAANELVYPTGTGEGPASAAEAAGLAVETTPYLEALAAFWRYYFPQEFDAVEQAHKTGNLFFSMECVPETVQCAMEGCDQTFPYKGRVHESYCDHLQAPRARRHLHKPHFTAGALIIPPARPGWKNADIKELTGLLKTYEEECEMALADAQQAAPELEAQSWERLMEMLAMRAGQVDAREIANDRPDLKQIHSKNKGKTHPFQPLGGDGGTAKGSPCKKCGKGKGAPIHGGGDGDKSALDVALEGRQAMDELSDIAMEALLFELAGDVPASTRKQAKKSGNTAYGDSFPVPNMSYLMKAIQAFGRAPEGKRSTLKSFLLRKARQLGASESVIKRIQSLSA